jgi:CBS-domain-containing membrane protein
VLDGATPTGETIMRIDKIMSHHVTTCGPHDSLEHAASLMWSADFQGKPLRELRVEDAMAKKVVTCRASDQVEDAEQLMQIEQIRRLPVLDNEDTLIGIVSMADLVRAAARLQFGQHHEVPASEVTATLAKISTPLERPVAA